MSYQAPPPGGEYGQPSYGVPQQNKKALWSMILGILGVVLCGIFTGIPAIILSRQAQAEGGSNMGMAKAGFILGIIACVVFVIGVIYRLAVR